MKEPNTDKCHFFYDGVFSQWAPSPFFYRGMEFCTAEQFMMFGKAAVFGDDVNMKNILATTSPRRQKQFGRQIKDYDDDRWLEFACPVVLLGTFLKFSQIHLFQIQMQSSTEVELYVEASPHDKRWGIGLALDNPDRLDFSKWDGDNLLGQAITDVRNLILEGDTSILYHLNDIDLFLQYYVKPQN